MISRWSAVVGAACVLGPAVRAQHVVEAGTGPRTRTVVGVQGAAPYVLNAQGKRANSPHRLILRAVPCYAEDAAVVAVTNAGLDDVAAPAASELKGAALRYHADLTASRELTSCYVVVSISRAASGTAEGPQTKNAFGVSRSEHSGPAQIRPGDGDLVVVRELPDLVAGETTSVDVVLPVSRSTARDTRTVMLFSGSAEVMLAALGPEQIQAERRKTKQHVLSTVSQRPPTPFVRVLPRLPAILRGREINAEALVRCRVDAEGNVAGAVIESTTHLAYGDAALTAARQWKFLPAIESHQFVERSVVVPFQFQSPAPKPPQPLNCD